MMIDSTCFTKAMTNIKQNARRHIPKNIDLHELYSERY